MGNKHYMFRTCWNNNWVLDVQVKRDLLWLVIGKHDIGCHRLGSKTKSGLLYNTTQLFLQGEEVGL